MAAGDWQGAGAWHSQETLQEVPRAMAGEVWPSQHKVGDQMSPDYVPLKSKQSPRHNYIVFEKEFITKVPLVARCKANALTVQDTEVLTLGW